MRKLMIPTLIAGGLALSGCASVLPMVLGTVVQQGIGAATRGSRAAIPSPQLQNAAVNACVQQAAQHGQASATTIQQISNGTLRVVGTVAANGPFQQRSFACSYRSDGRITEFRLE